MNRYLLFRLYGPMAAWGGTAVGEYRPSDAQPSRTAILGLLAAAVGIRRDQEDALNDLDRSVEIAVRLDMPGEVMRDYHTTQVPPEGKKLRYYGRSDETRSEKLHTILSQRDYRTDSGASVALRLLSADANRLAGWQAALRAPVFPLYLGRKSCPLALPTDPCIADATNFESAFAAYPGCGSQLAKLDSGWQDRSAPELIRYFWEGDDNSLQATMSYPRRDRLLSRRRWQFGTRTEYQAAHSTDSAVDKES